jgi:tetratricopeptide (TPR) repeat protein
MKNTVTIFKETDFGKAVHKASTLHNEGYYEEALLPWLEVLKYDGTYNRAYLGVAAAKLRSGDYKEAMKYAELADAGKIYDKAFEGYRMDFIKSNFEPLLLAVIFGSIAIAGSLKIRKDKKAALAAERKKEKTDEREV